MAFSDYKNVSQIQRQFKVGDQLEKPLMVIAEAKKNDFEQGWGRCLAGLVAARRINGDGRRTVFGVVTDGKLWEFGKLQESLFTKNIESFTVDHLARLFGAPHSVFQSAVNHNNVAVDLRII